MHDHELGQHLKLTLVASCVHKLIAQFSDNNREPSLITADRFRTLSGIRLSARAIRKYLFNDGAKSAIATVSM